jgi:hypothetical protein
VTVVDNPGLRGEGLRGAGAVGGAMKRVARKALQQTTAGSRYLVKREYGVRGPHGRPDAPWPCAVLSSADEVEESVAQLKRLGLPLAAETSKNWDSLAALDLILRRTNTKSRIFDAGGELYSMILPWLCMYGYRNLIAGNLVFPNPVRRGTIVYQYSDITQTEFESKYFEAITCLSVIEHGLNLDEYFREMSRILADGGVLITSTDYFETPIDTTGHIAYGAPVRVFTKQDILSALTLAERHGLHLISPLDLQSTEKVVHWEEYDLDFTFVIFSLQKDSRRAPRSDPTDEALQGGVRPPVAFPSPPEH